jgi:hypothetical protein
MNTRSPELILRADKADEFRVRLGGLEIDVPARSEGRTTHQVERYSVAHLLITLPVERISFPLMLTHRDRPDFLLEMPSGDLGIEHTEAVPENIANAQAMRERGLGPDVYCIPRARPGEPRKTADQLRCEIEADEPGDGWYGNAPKREWAEAMAHYVKAKLPKAMEDGFTRYPENWLVVYDNWPLPPFNYSNAAPFLVQHLNELGAFSVFDAIFVHDDSQICEFRRDGVRHTLVNPSI